MTTIADFAREFPTLVRPNSSWWMSPGKATKIILNAQTLALYLIWDQDQSAYLRPNPESSTDYDLGMLITMMNNAVPEILENTDYTVNRASWTISLTHDAMDTLSRSSHDAYQIREISEIIDEKRTVTYDAIRTFVSVFRWSMDETILKLLFTHAFHRVYWVDNVPRLVSCPDGLFKNNIPLRNHYAILDNGYALSDELVAALIEATYEHIELLSDTEDREPARARFDAHVNNIEKVLYGVSKKTNPASRRETGEKVSYSKSEFFDKLGIADMDYEVVEAAWNMLIALNKWWFVWKWAEATLVGRAIDPALAIVKTIIKA